MLMEVTGVKALLGDSPKTSSALAQLNLSMWSPMGHFLLS